tara:strand:- start:239 stop:487 length:249 start_codon:yes stop_codon:yes gene_type:complete
MKKYSAKKIEKEILDIASKVLKVKKSKLSLKSSTKNLLEWDSLNHVNLMIELKRNFNLNFKISEVSEINNLNQWHKLIIKKY